MTTPATHAPEILGLATCPSCHAVEPGVTNLAVSAGAEWHCARCGSRWDAVRLAAVGAYAVWAAERAASAVVRATQTRGEV